MPRHTRSKPSTENSGFRPRQVFAALTRLDALRPLAVISLRKATSNCFRATPSPTKAGLFVAPREVPLEPPRFEHTSEPNCSCKGKTLTIERECCLWGTRHWQEQLSQSEFVLELLNDAVAFA